MRRQRTKLTGQISDAVNAIADHFFGVRIRAALAKREDRQAPSGVTGGYLLHVRRAGQVMQRAVSGKIDRHDTRIRNGSP
jgi:hypothetical protein